MTDRTHPDSGFPIAYSHYANYAEYVEALHARIAELEAQLESIGAGGVSGPMMGQPQEMPDLTKLTERGAKAWAGVDAQRLREGRHQPRGHRGGMAFLGQLGQQQGKGVAVHPAQRVALLGHAAQPRRLLHEMARVARPGAPVLATLPLRGSFHEFHALMAGLVESRPREKARLEAHLTSWPDAAALYDWAADAGLEDITVVAQPFSLLLAGAADLFFAPVIEYGPLSQWKAILGERGPDMQAAFNELREAIDLSCATGQPFVLTVRAACLRARKPRPPALPTFEEDPDNAPTSPGH